MTDAVLEGLKDVVRMFEEGGSAQVDTAISPEEIKAIRVALKLNQTDFASRLRVSTDTIKSWESGRRTPKGPVRLMLIQLSNALIEKETA